LGDHDYALYPMDPTLRAPSPEPVPMTRKEFLGGLSSKKRDGATATVLVLFTLSATISQCSVLAILLYLIGVI